MTPNLKPATAQLRADITAVVGDACVKTVADAPRYLEDPRGRFSGRGNLVVLPRSTEQVAAIVRMCNAARTGLLPYGGGTGVVAGQLSILSDNLIILSLERMDQIRSFSRSDHMIVAEAGCILQDVQAAAVAQDMIFPLDMASKGSCTIGGNLATNAGGIQVLRYGNARDLCLGIEAVLPNGSVFSELSPLRKNNTGYDIRHLLIGSEGTLGVITAATLALKSRDPEAATVLGAVVSPAAAVALLHHLRASLGECLCGVELMSDFGLDLVTAKFPALHNPVRHMAPWYLLIEATGSAGLRARIEVALAEAMKNNLLVNAVIAESQAQSDALWALREHTPEANRLTGTVCNSDTSVPISKVDAFITLTNRLVGQVHPGLRINSYGHVGDGNIHHNVFPPEGMTKSDYIATNPGAIDLIRTAVNEATIEFNGSISAEHGIGRLKTADFEHYSSEAKLQVVRSIKRALDPNNILNPGALLAKQGY